MPALDKAEVMAVWLPRADAMSSAAGSELPVPAPVDEVATVTVTEALVFGGEAETPEEPPAAASLLRLFGFCTAEEAESAAVTLLPRFSILRLAVIAERSRRLPLTAWIITFAPRGRLSARLAAMAAIWVVLSVVAPFKVRSVSTGKSVTTTETFEASTFDASAIPAARLAAEKEVGSMPPSESGTLTVV